ncbi:MAG: hypothetical protein Q7R85_03560 [bacterium]|nr:hypothetical protein [bacterium]
MRHKVNWGAWVGRFVCALIRATRCGAVSWDANRRNTRYSCTLEFEGEVFLIAVTQRESYAIGLRVSYVVFRDNRWMQCEVFFLGDAGGRFPLEKLCATIRKQFAAKNGEER